MKASLDEIRDAAFPIGWCKTWGLPCEGAHTDCCGKRVMLKVVSLNHVADVLSEDRP